MMADVDIRGGTHVPWSPCYDYLERQWARWLARLGLVRLGLLASQAPERLFARAARPRRYSSRC